MGEETGQIKSGVGPFLAKRLRERRLFTWREAFPTRGDKAVRAQSIRGRMALDGLYMLKDAPFRADLVAEMMSFPVGLHDDQVDALGLVGQLIDKMIAGTAPKPAPKPDEHVLVGQPDGSVRTTLTVGELIKRQTARRTAKGSVRI